MNATTLWVIARLASGDWKTSTPSPGTSWIRLKWSRKKLSLVTGDPSTIPSAVPPPFRISSHSTVTWSSKTKIAPEEAFVSLSRTTPAPARP